MAPVNCPHMRIYILVAYVSLIFLSFVIHKIDPQMWFFFFKKKVAITGIFSF